MSYFIQDYNNPESLKYCTTFTSIHLAAFYNDSRIFESAVYQIKPYLNTKDCYGNTPLHIAASLGHSNFAKGLIDNGADVEGLTPSVRLVGCKQNEFICFTPMHVAALHGHTSIVEVLAKAGASVSRYDCSNQENTPAHLAIWNYHIDTFMSLVENGADLLAKNYLDHIPVCNSINYNSHLRKSTEAITALNDYAHEVNDQKLFGVISSFDCGFTSPPEIN